MEIMQESYVGMEDRVIPPVKRGSNSVCKRWILYNAVTGESTQFRCGSPRCQNEECHKYWARQRIYLIADLVDQHRLDKFFTLTMTREMTLLETWRTIHHVWAKMLCRLRRVAISHGVVFKFVVVLERHKDGYPHIHGFTDLYMEQREWSNMWVACGGGWKVDVRAVQNSKGAARYVAKYVGKSNILGALQYIPKKARTMWRTTGMYTVRELQGKEIAWWCDCVVLPTDWKLVKTKIRWMATPTKMLDMSKPDVEMDVCETWPESDLSMIPCHDALRHRTTWTEGNAVRYGIESGSDEIYILDKYGARVYDVVQYVMQCTERKMVSKVLKE